MLSKVLRGMPRCGVQMHTLAQPAWAAYVLRNPRPKKTRGMRKQLGGNCELSPNVLSKLLQRKQPFVSSSANHRMAVTW